MIVSNTWCTYPYRKTRYGSRSHRVRWEGFWLFGFIPLYIREIECSVYE